MTEREEDAEMLRAAATDVAGYEENLLDRLHEALPLREQPGILQGGKLRPYQLEGLNWLAGLYRNGVSGILADEMGLGKTVQTVAMIGRPRHSNPRARDILAARPRLTDRLRGAGMLAQNGAPGFHAVLAPKSTLSNWEKEFAKWLPSCRLIVLQGSAEERREIVRTRLETGDFDVLLTSYEVFLREKNAIRKVGALCVSRRRQTPRHCVACVRCQRELTRCALGGWRRCRGGTLPSTKRTALRTRPRSWPS